MTLLSFVKKAKPSLQHKIDLYVKWEKKEKEPISISGIRKFLSTIILDSRIKSLNLLPHQFMQIYPLGCEIDTSIVKCEPKLCNGL